MDYGYQVKREKHPKEDANLFSVLSFAYMIKIFCKGYKKDLEEEDVCQVIPSLKSKTIGDRLEQQWQLEKFHHKRASIYRLLLVCYGRRYLILGVIQLLVETCIHVLKPLALGKLVLYFTPGQTELTHNDAYCYALLVISLNLLVTFYEEHYQLAKAQLALEIRMAFCSLIYRKVLKLDSQVLSDMSTGKIVTLITKDVNALDLAIHFGNEFWVEMLQAIFMCYLIYNKVGTASSVSVTAFLLTFPIQIIFGRLVYWKRSQTNKRSDRRLQLTQEILSVIRTIKMYAWETFFCDKIANARKQEMNKLRTLFILKDGAIFIGGLVGKLSYYLLLLVFLWLGNNLTAEIVYYIHSCYGKFRYILTYLIPLGLAEWAELLASMNRIDTLFNADEIKSKGHKKETFMSPRVVFRDANINISGSNVLKKLNMNLETGLNVIIGSVGSGKSTLIKTMLREYRPNDGNLFTNGVISYASQQSWLFPSTIRQNILFGLPYDDTRYKKIVEVCALKLDFDMFAKGDQTIIGDCGTNLSKGQQARINLARAVYRDSDIYLIDDSLSSLDVNVQNYIFTNCVRDFLGKKLVVLVTHNNSFLRDADNVTILNEGEITYTGKYDKIYFKHFHDETEITSDAPEAEKHSKPILNGNAVDEKHLPIKNQNNIYGEEKKSGTVDWKVYRKYICFGGWVTFVFILFLHVTVEGISMYGEKLVSKWVNNQHENSTNLTIEEVTTKKHNNNVMMYTIVTIVVATAISKFARSVIHFLFSFRACKKIHLAMVDSVVRCDIQFFDKHLIGNILNRFSKDLGLVDEYVPYTVNEVLRAMCIATSTILLIVSVNLLFFIFILILLILFILISMFYLPTGRSLKRLDASTRSPIIGQLNATLEGLVSVRAFQIEKLLIEQFDEQQDVYTSAQYMFQTGLRSLSMTYHMFCVVFVAVIIGKFLFFNSGSQAGDVGLALSQAFSLGAFLQWSMRNWIHMESVFTFVERVFEYTELKQENKSGKSPPDWPTKGSLEFNKVNLTYRLNNEQVLNNITFSIRPNEKVGIVGRTGAGKSSIIVTLYRLYETSGSICVDKENINELALEFFRSHISIIPQEPIIFSGTIRTNIDPFNKYSEKEIWQALEAVNLKEYVNNLDNDIKKNYNFSLGQKQLLSIARAIVRKNKIIVLDEATANMDKDTEKLIHLKMDELFKFCTIIIVAHRMETIINCDKVIVMDKGFVVEFDTPQALIENQESQFYNMVKKAGALNLYAEKNS